MLTFKDNIEINIVVSTLKIFDIMEMDVESLNQEIEDILSFSKNGVKWYPILKLKNIYNDYFDFIIRDKGSMKEITIWDKYSYLIYKTKYSNDTLNEKTREIIDSVNNRSNGYIQCSNCGELVEFESVQNNTLYAGIYCGKCWADKFKTLAENENYN